MANRVQVSIRYSDVPRLGVGLNMSRLPIIRINTTVRGQVDVSDPNMAVDTVSVVAQEDIPAFTPVTVDGRICDSNNVLHYKKLLGISKAAILTGNSGLVQVEGVITNPGWSWAVGETIFLNNTNLSNTSDFTTLFINRIGLATAIDKFLIEIDEAILL